MGFQLVKLLNDPVTVTTTLNPEGAYVAETAYTLGDSVSYNGTSYVAIQSTTGNLPTDTTYWQVLAEKGDKGDTGLGITEESVGFTLTGGTTPKTLTVPLDASVSGTNTGDQTLPVKASGSEITTGTDDAKFATAKALKDAGFRTVADTQPSDVGLLAWTADPAITTSSYALATKGTAYGARIYIPKAMTISNIHVGTAGSAATNLSNAFMALYQGGSLLVQTDSQITNWQASTGLKNVAITPQAVTAGSIDIIWWASDWTTAPTFIRGAGYSTVNVGTGSSTLRFFTADTGLTTTAPATLGAKTALSVAFWVAVS